MGWGGVGRSGAGSKALLVPTWEFVVFAVVLISAIATIALLLLCRNHHHTVNCWPCLSLPSCDALELEAWWRGLEIGKVSK